MFIDRHQPVSLERLNLILAGIVDPDPGDLNGLLAWIDLHQPAETEDIEEFKREQALMKLKMKDAKANSERIQVNLDLAIGLLAECANKRMTPTLTGRVKKFIANVK